MPLDPVQLLGWPISAVEQAWSERDAAFYALALGLPADPLSPDDLPYVYEGAAGGLRVLPTFATVLADPGFWLSDPRLGLDWPRMLHAGQSIVIHRPLASSGSVRSSSRVVEVRDDAAGRGAWVVTERELRDADDGLLYCVLRQTSLLRGDGGFDPAKEALKTAARAPSGPRRAPDCFHDHQTPLQAALLFRLCADMNPLHADPAVAASAGYDRPILHGMATCGVACHGVLAALRMQPAALEKFDARFTAPVFPGDLLRTRVWGDAQACEFDVWVAARDAVVLRGSAAAFQ